jgi:hypothetical protein
MGTVKSRLYGLASRLSVERRMKFFAVVGTVRQHVRTTSTTRSASNYTMRACPTSTSWSSLSTIFNGATTALGIRMDLQGLRVFEQVTLLVEHLKFRRLPYSGNPQMRIQFTPAGQHCVIRAACLRVSLQMNRRRTRARKGNLASGTEPESKWTFNE